MSFSDSSLVGTPRGDILWSGDCGEDDTFLHTLVETYQVRLNNVDIGHLTVLSVGSCIVCVTSSGCDFLDKMDQVGSKSVTFLGRVPLTTNGPSRLPFPILLYYFAFSKHVCSTANYVSSVSLLYPPRIPCTSERLAQCR